MRSVDIWNAVIAFVVMGLAVLWPKPREAGNAERTPAVAKGSRWITGRGVYLYISVDQRLSRLRRPLWLFITVAVYLLIGSALWQTGFNNTFRMAAYAGLALGAILYPKFGIGLVLIWLIWSLYDFAGSPHPALDLTLLSIAFIAALFLVLCRHQGRWHLRFPTDFQALAVALLFISLAWAFVSMGDWISTGDQNYKNSHLANEKRPNVSTKFKIGLALSGGGYRAALFHAGVVAALEELQDPIEVISSVSGGSIFASFYARGGNPKQFVDSIVQGSMRLERYILRMDNAFCLLGSIRVPAGESSFSLLPFFPKCSRTSMQSDLLRRVFLGDVLAREGSVPGRPELMLGITDIAGNRMMGVTPSGFVNVWLHGSLERFSYANPAGLGGRTNEAVFFPNRLAHLPGDQQLAALVAASGAFPGALPAYRLRAPYTLDGYPPSSSTYLLADGGLTDNSGIVLLDAGQLLSAEADQYIRDPIPNRNQNPPTEWHMTRWNVDLILASDASAYASGNLPSSAFSEFVQAMDVASGNSGGADMFVRRDQAENPRPPTLLLSPRSFSPDPAIVSNRHLVIALPGVEGFQVANKQYSVPVELSEETLRYIVDHMSDESREEANRLLTDLIKGGLISQDGMPEPVRSALLTSRDLTGKSALEKLDRFTLLVAREFERRLITFIRTPTLRDQIDDATAQSIFTLGEYIARVNQRHINCYLSNLEAIKRSRDTGNMNPCWSAGDLTRLPNLGDR